MVINDDIGRMCKWSWAILRDYSSNCLYVLDYWVVSRRLFYNIGYVFSNVKVNGSEELDDCRKKWRLLILLLLTEEHKKSRAGWKIVEIRTHDLQNMNWECQSLQLGFCFQYGEIYTKIKKMCVQSRVEKWHKTKHSDIVFLCFTKRRWETSCVNYCHLSFILVLLWD